MAEAVLEIKKWGNNLGVRFPAVVAAAANLRANQRVHVAVINGRVVITPEENRSLSLKQCLALFDPVRHGGEVMMAKAQGAERW